MNFNYYGLEKSIHNFEIWKNTVNENFTEDEFQKLSLQEKMNIIRDSFGEEAYHNVIHTMNEENKLKRFLHDIK